MYQITEFYHPIGLAGTAIRAAAPDVFRKADAIAICKAHSFHAQVTERNYSDVIYDNGKPNAQGD